MVNSATDHEVEGSADLKQKTARGVLTSVIGQAANFALRIGSMVIIARLVTPEHFGLVGMVTAFTGMLGLFRDAGLSVATIQRATISNELVSALFWINLAIGMVLAGVTAAAAPLLAAFYGDPRLLWITIALGSSFIFSGAMAQHRALLQRRMRFGILATIDILALVLSIGIGLWMALGDLGYWALVGMATSQPLISFAGVWIGTGWNPGMPRRAAGIRSMLRYGGVITLNSLIVYIAYNADKVLVGRTFGAEVLGLYGRAYQLVSLPTENLHSTLSWVMFPALSRLQYDPVRQRSFFLEGYGLFLSVVMPITVACGLFAEDIVRVFLGPQWGQAAPVFRLLAPTILAFAMINPMAYLMQTGGHAVRSLKVALVIAPVVIAGYAIGLSRGPTGVALGFSAAMLILILPVIHWAKRGTLITTRDIVRTFFPPLLSTLLGAAVAIAAGKALSGADPLTRVAILPFVLLGTHALVLIFCFGRRRRYLDLLRATVGRRNQDSLAPTNV